MVTLVGTQGSFVDALKELIELEFDAIEAYETAITRLQNEKYKTTLTEFKGDHGRHVKELRGLLIQHDIVPPTGPSMGKHWITKGKVVIANLTGGDEAILLAMKSNEMDTNTAYRRMNERLDIWDDAKDIIERGLEDEIGHKKWLEDHFKKI
ncbi:DUF2383 domain-containing protein [Candidatus Paracaedibacter symbiosus]|uniref:DUF2383 domain-containing protein n=1 Tax=Candidatus Paracaedibacter symbiosus TaxID=244582 RepID=UPI000509F756|nr:ferritin-like domain-containing protein [Candidatus Paracaedibacter symbiosus]